MLVAYLSGHDRYRPECDLAYDNQLMVMLWSSLATRDVRLAEQALARRAARARAHRLGVVPALPRRHRLGRVDADAAAAGLGGFPHRRFLSDFYAGRFPGSFARGALFQDNPATGDARISGMAASLCGMEDAGNAGDEQELTLAIRRLESMYAVVFSFGGIPLIYMGDEIALPSDPRWAADPAHAHDNRWMHRPAMDWAAAGRRHDPATVEGRVFAAVRALSLARQRLLALRSGGTTEILPGREPARAGLPPGAPAQRPVPVADELQRPGAVRGRGHHRPGLAWPGRARRRDRDRDCEDAARPAGPGSSSRPGASPGSPVPERGAGKRGGRGREAGRPGPGSGAAGAGKAGAGLGKPGPGAVTR